MATPLQIQQLNTRLKRFKSKYLRKEYSNLDESATRLIINSFLTEVLGYKELDEIKTEYQIRGEYADYVIQLKRKKHFVVEVKSIQLDLCERHLRQSLNYAANEGVDWILLSNGRQLELYRVSFGKPISTSLVMSMDFINSDDFKKAAETLIYLTKKCVERGKLEEYWKRFNALAPDAISKLIYSEDVVKILRRELKGDTGIYFQMDDVANSVYEALAKKVDFGKPKLRPSKK